MAGPARGLILLLLAGPVAAQQAPADRLADVERRFAREAGQRGFNTTMHAMAAEDAVLFRPDPVPARAWLAAHADRPGAPRLIWGPAVAEVSAAGDLGFTSGPYAVHPAEGGPVLERGNFFTVWVGRGDEWRFLVDHGAPSPAPLDTAAGTVRHVGTGVREPGPVPALDAVLAHDSAATRDTASWRAALAADAVLLRADEPTRIGAGSAAPGTWRPAGGWVARSGDLAAVYGTRLRDGRLGEYVRVWRRERTGWRIAAEVVTDRPPGR